MRLLPSLTAAALAGLAAGASQQKADVYILSSSRQGSTETPSIPKEVARHILLQRTSRQQYGSDLRDIPSSIDAEAAVDHIARFGKSPTPLFGTSAKTEASHLVVILEGATSEQSKQLQGKLGENAAFTVSDPPSATANKELMTLFRNLGVAPPKQCELSLTINPFETDCWTGSSSVVKYDLRKSPETLDTLFTNLPRLNKFITDNTLEVLLLVLPESSRTSKLNHWSAAAAASSSDLRRRRDAEAVISDATANTHGATPKLAPAAADSPPAEKPKPKTRIPQCFPSLNSCTTQTNSCSGHGECVDKYAPRSGSGNNTEPSGSAAAPASCFACVCKASLVERADAPNKGRKTVHWGGNMCQKEDVSVQFWLIAGFTITIAGVVAFAIGLLYSVGEEKLPGVIGAGVSRSK